MSEPAPPIESPEEVELDPEPDVVESGALVNAFLKALKAYRLYLPNNHTLRSFVDAFYSGLQAFLGRHGELCLRVAQFHIAYRGVPVYENRTKEESLAFRMFIHGVREITFHAGVSREEVMDFLQVIHRSFDSKTSVDDLLSLLWEKDLRFITFIILDDFFDEGGQAEFDEFVEEGRRADHTAAPVKSAASSLLTRLLARSGQGSRDPLPDIFHLTEEERARIAGWIEEEDGKNLVVELCGLLMELLDPAASLEDARELLKIFEHVFQALLSEGKLTQAAQALAELRRFQTAEEEGPLRRLVGDALSSMGGEKIVRAVRPHLASASPGDRELLVQLLASLDQTAVSPLIDLLEHPDARSVALEVLDRLARDHLGVILTRLSDPRPAVVAMLVRLVGRIGDPRALPALEAPLFHPATAVRVETLKAIEQIGTEAGLGLLAKIVGDPDQDIRVRAVRSIASLPAELARDPLLAIARGRGFAKRSYFEKKEILLALGRVRDAEIEDYLISVLRRRRLFRREEFDDLRACAAKALARLATPRAIGALQARTRDRSPQVRRAVAFALRSLHSPPPPDPA